jgi:4-alpha-glucanotransferase
MTTDVWGIDDGYEDALGVWRPTTPDTRRAILDAMGVDHDSPEDTAPDPVLVVRQGRPVDLDEPGDLVLEDGTLLTVGARLPPDLPTGYHELRTGRGPRTVIVDPGQCASPAAGSWGWAVQLYAARSRASWGIGDFADLARIAAWSARLGAQVVVVNPLHPAVPRTVEDPSPYAPSSRRYLNPLYLRIEDVPGADGLGPDLDRLRAAGQALNRERRIDRGAVARLKREALDHLWARFSGDGDFDRYVADEGAALEAFATFCALAETHETVWPRWPSEYRRPESGAVRRFAAERRDRVRFHQWLQWLLDTQVRRAARHVAIVHDFPIGVDPDGADAWAWQDVLTTGASVGAPPDRFNRRGQDWGLPPFVPHRLRARRYEPITQTLRAAFRHGGGLRIDHVMGLFRLFWVPRGLAPVDGAYVRYRADELLAIIALESQRAGAFVVGEDLGTVERGVRGQLAALGVLSTRVLWFESAPPRTWPELALATATTHDLPTIAGLWSGADLAAQRRLGLEPSAEAFAENRRRLAALSGVSADGRAQDVIAGTYRALASAPSMVVTATLEDALAVEERPNMPGTTREWPNWCLALPVPLETLEEAPLARAIASALASRAVSQTGQEIRSRSA